MHDVAIIGGGLAGLTSAIILADAGLDVVLYEKKGYPFHKVCGEYVSNEVLPFLQNLGADPLPLAPARISRFQLVSPAGKALTVPLGMGGFGISRYTLDNYLKARAQKNGAGIIDGTGVNEVNWQNDSFYLRLSDGRESSARVVIGAFGKRSSLDRKLDREFFKRRSPWLAVKYHVRANFPNDLIALYNFPGGYCGINSIEEDKLCLCYLTKRENLRKTGDIGAMEREILYRNPALNKFFEGATHLYQKPEAINEIGFDNKEVVKGHLLMAGDAAGMIAPLCGNGMAMAIHAAKLASEEIVLFLNGRQSRAQMEMNYARKWDRHFARRMWFGRKVQYLFGKETLSGLTVNILRKTPVIVRQLIRSSHGALLE